MNIECTKPKHLRTEEHGLLLTWKKEVQYVVVEKSTETKYTISWSLHNMSLII